MVINWWQARCRGDNENSMKCHTWWIDGIDINQAQRDIRQRHLHSTARSVYENRVRNKLHYTWHKISLYDPPLTLTPTCAWSRITPDRFISIVPSAFKLKTALEVVHRELMKILLLCRHDRKINGLEAGGGRYLWNVRDYTWQALRIITAHIHEQYCTDAVMREEGGLWISS